MANEKSFPRGKYFSSRKTMKIFLEYFPRINYSLDPYSEPREIWNPVTHCNLQKNTTKQVPTNTSLEYPNHPLSLKVQYHDKSETLSTIAINTTNITKQVATPLQNILLILMLEYREKSDHDKLLFYQ